MYYQTNCLTKDGASAPCRIVSTTDSGFMVEYLDDEGTWKEAELAADQVFQHEYEGQEISQ
tara:strand:- start:1812 stop:1994 length:183 start_codon:yes stop_codon:yes gene_type:complete